MVSLVRSLLRGWTLGAAILLVAGLCLSGCRQPAIDTLAVDHGFTSRTFHGETFDLKWLSRGTGPTLRAYIEGDGKAWLTRRRPSSDPTPHEPVAFELASQDRAEAVAYLARPCQFIGDGERRNCVVPFWTSARFSETVIRDMSAALDEAMRVADAHRLELVGYSGGGGVALLVAARRDDVALVVTVAGNLDHAHWTAFHGVSPLRDSLNPVDFADRLQAVPQVHLVSDDDDVIPPSVARSYVGHMADPGPVRVIVVHGVEHDGDWGAPLASVLREVP